MPIKELAVEAGADAQPRDAGRHSARNLTGSSPWQLLERWGEIGVLVIIGAVFYALRSRFLAVDNIDGMVQSVVVIFLISLGVMMSVAVGGFDLSVGAIASLSSMFAAGAMVLYQWPPWAAVLAALAIGATIGMINGFVIVRFGVSDIVATLGMMFVVSGIQQTYSHGENIYPHMQLAIGGTAPGTIANSVVQLANGSIGPVPVPAFIIAGFGLVMWYLMDQTRWGRYFYATGDNREAARVAGIGVGRVRIAAYVLSGILAAAGGVLLTGLLDSGNTDVGSPYLLEAVTTVFLGVTVLGRGRANVFGTLVGCVFLAVMLDGLTLLNMPYTSQDIFKGGLLLAAVLLGVLAGRRQERAGARALD